jgi:hypothetical protein
VSVEMSTPWGKKTVIIPVEEGDVLLRKHCIRHGYCINCMRSGRVSRGHKARDCPYDKREEYKKKGMCQKCWKVGHIERECSTGS